MPQKLKTTGHLRAFLLKAIEDVSLGTLEPNRAHAITKIASQINASLLAEIEVAQIRLKDNQPLHKFGELEIAADIEPATKLIVATPSSRAGAGGGTSVGSWAEPKYDAGDPPPGRSALDQRGKSR